MEIIIKETRMHVGTTNNIRNLLRAFKKVMAAHPLPKRQSVCFERIKTLSFLKSFSGASGNFSRNSININYVYCRTLANIVLQPEIAASLKQSEKSPLLGENVEWSLSSCEGGQFILEWGGQFHRHLNI